MSSAYIYLDESGDLGWTLNQPYRRGGSSRHLTIAALIVSPENRHRPKRVIQKLYKKYSWDVAQERKWSDMKQAERVVFAERSKQLVETLQDVKYFSITVKKENVQGHIRQDSNKLYNYMINLLLSEEMARYDSVTLVPDPRSIKVESGNSLHDYLQTQLWFERGVQTQLNTCPCDSSCSRNVQFADMLSGLIQSHHEDRRSDPWKVLGPCIRSKALYF